MDKQHNLEVPFSSPKTFSMLHVHLFVFYVPLCGCICMHLCISDLVVLRSDKCGLGLDLGFSQRQDQLAKVAITSTTFGGIMHPKIKHQISFIQTHVVPNLYDLISFAEHNIL